MNYGKGSESNLCSLLYPTGVNASQKKKLSRNMEKLQLPAELNETFGQNLPCPPPSIPEGVEEEVEELKASNLF